MSRSPTIVRTAPAFRRALDNLRPRKATTALVPTMGALHDGHMSLVRLAKRHASRSSLTRIVNVGFILDYFEARHANILGQIASVKEFRSRPESMRLIDNVELKSSRP